MSVEIPETQIGNCDEAVFKTEYGTFRVRVLGNYLEILSDEGKQVQMCTTHGNIGANTSCPYCGHSIHVYHKRAEYGPSFMLYEYNGKRISAYFQETKKG